MIKKTYVLFLTIMLCATTLWPKEEDNRYQVGTLTLANTIALATAYTLVSIVSTEVTLDKESKKKMLAMMTGIAAITTTGCVLVEGINGLDHLVNPSNKKNPELKADIKKLPE